MSESTSFKKFTNKKQFARKRKPSTSESNSSESDQETSVVRKNKSKKINPNVFQSNLHKLKRKETSIKSDESNSEDDDKKITIGYKSSRTGISAGPSDQGATATVEIDTDINLDAQALFEKRMEINKELEGLADDKIYRGLNNYTQFIKKKDTAMGNASSGLVRQGPMRAPAHLRATVRWDYQPDICKDYKETGFCGFGDSCKFLHDRSDYKAGWQMETVGGANDSGDDDTKYEIPDDEEELPFKCFICRESFVDPIITKCKHYFCEKCALANYKKSKRCFICGLQTNGMFNPAKILIAKLKEREEDEKLQNSDDENNDE